MNQLSKFSPAVIGILVVLLLVMSNQLRSSPYCGPDPNPSAIFEKVRLQSPTLIMGLTRNYRAITFDEFGPITDLAKDERVLNLVYFNQYGDVRWFKDPSSIKLPFDEFAKRHPPQTNAIDEAYKAKLPQVRVVADPPSYELVVPLAVRGEVKGLLDLQVRRSSEREGLNYALCIGRGNDVQQALDSAVLSQVEAPAATRPSVNPMGTSREKVVLHQRVATTKVKVGNRFIEVRGVTEANRRAAESYQIQGLSSFSTGNYDKAKVEWIECTHLDPTNSDCAQGLQKVAEILSGKPAK